MPSWMACAQRPSGLIKVGKAQACLIESTLIKVENVSQKRISTISLNCYWIKLYFHDCQGIYWVLPDTDSPNYWRKISGLGLSLAQFYKQFMTVYYDRRKMEKSLTMTQVPMYNWNCCFNDQNCSFEQF